MKRANEHEIYMNSLISKLIHNYMGLIEKDKNFSFVFEFVKNYLTNNSLIYSPQPREIEIKIQSLLEKLEINSQFEKAKLLFDLICRLKTLFSNKNINTEILLNSLYIILQLAHSPLQTSLDIEMLRERFEERYIRHESNKILRNQKFNLNLEDINFKRTVEFESVDYNEETPSLSEEGEFEISHFEEEKQEKSKFNQEENKENKNINLIARRPLKSKILNKKLFCDSDDNQVFMNPNFYKIQKTDLDRNFMFNTEKKIISKIQNKNYLLSIIKNLIPQFDEFKDEKINSLNFIEKFPYLFPSSLSIENIEISSHLEHFLQTNLRYDKNIQKLLTDIYYQIFYSDNSYKNQSNQISSASLNIFKNSICVENVFQNYLLHYHNRDPDSIKYFVDSDFILNSLLINLTYFDQTTIENKDSFLNKFSNFICIDVRENLISNILLDFNSTLDNLNFLRQIDLVLERHGQGIKNSIIIGKFCYLIKEFLNFHDKVIDGFIKLLNYQKGKISILNRGNLFINENINSTKIFFLEEIVRNFNFFLHLFNENSQNTKKFSLIKFTLYYKREIFPILKYFIIFSENILSIKSNLSKANKFSNSLFIKEVFDFFYSFIKNKISLVDKKQFCFLVELLFHMIESYLQIVYEFSINGNLIDINNEFFIDHMFTKKDNKKIIFNFNEKFQKFNWIESFKIKSFSYRGDEGACVPMIFMIDNLHFKILETSKSTFLIKNLRSNDKINFDFLINENDQDIDLKKFIENFSNYLCEALKIFNLKEKDYFNYDSEKIIKLNDKLVIQNSGYIDGMNQEDIRISQQNYEKNLIGLNSKFQQNQLTGEILDDIKIPFRIYEKISEKNNKNPNIKFLENYDELNYINQTFKLDVDLIRKSEINIIKNKCSNVLDTNSVNSKFDPKNNFCNYKTYMINSKGKVEEIKEISEMINLIIDNEKEKNKLKSEKKNSNISSTVKTEDNQIFNLDIIIKSLIHSKIIHINKIINQKLLNYFFSQENLLHHFNLVFSIYLFKAGFCMNKFVIELNDFLQKGIKNDNFFLKNLLNELCVNSDLVKYKSMIRDFTHLNFKENSGIYINNYHDILFMDYQPKLPVSIFFDANVINYYNSIFNYMIKIKKTNFSINNGEVDKKIKTLGSKLSEFPGTSNSKKILKYFINLRMHIMNFMSNLEFYVFYTVVDQKINKFLQKIKNFKSIDSLINYHMKFIKEIHYYLGIRNEKLNKTLFKILNLCGNFNILLTKFLLLVSEFDEVNRENILVEDLEKLELIYIDVHNFTQTFKKKELKIEQILTEYKEKTKN